MNDGERLRRQDPARTGPLRNFSGLYRQTAEGHEAATSSESTSGADAGSGPEPPDNDGVRLAYRVIEKHISDGKRDAGTLNDRPYNTRSVTDGFQELLERTLRYQTELIPLWIEALGSAVRVEPGRMGQPPERGWKTESNGNGGSNHTSKIISMEIASVRPVEVSIDLRENSATMPLVILGLRNIDQNKPALDEISFLTDATTSAIKLRISIPPSQPPGTYSGVIVNRETGEARGTLSVSIAE